MNTIKTLALLPMLAVAVCAQAQQRKVVPAGQDYTIESFVAASGSNVTYQWFRDGAAIANATSASYTVPAILAKHENGLSANYSAGSKFQRAAYGIDCSGGMAMSNIIIVYFCDLMVNGVCWARANVENYGRISSNPWDLGNFYQWNRPNTAYSPTSPAAGVVISGWNNTPDYAAEWTNGFPCPSEWRLPTQQDFQNLHAMSKTVGGQWLDNQARGIPLGVSGRLYGYNTDYCTMSNMVGCVFLPASGRRSGGTGALQDSNSVGNYWGKAQTTNILGQSLFFNSASTVSSNESLKTFALPIRCVQDVQ